MASPSFFVSFSLLPYLSIRKKITKFIVAGNLKAIDVVSSSDFEASVGKNIAVSH
ncbi:hypothetical protein MTR_2g090815 [Medicago truncatula]|uniref:Uncharacterized protein n=1 Tax=Medicago truncatula TaxID=3880 RepID=G7ZUK6_MEDTR|nr:hypothetical protein MTR_2g090815 [Medicago truncatula]